MNCVAPTHVYRSMLASPNNCKSQICVIITQPTRLRPDADDLRSGKAWGVGTNLYKK